MLVEAVHGRRIGPSPSEIQLENRRVADEILRRAQCLMGLPDYRVRSFTSACGKKSATVVERKEEGFPLVAAIVCEEGKPDRATLYGSLDGTAVEVSTGNVNHYGVVPVYREGNNRGEDQAPWNIIFVKNSPYLTAVGITPVGPFHK
jgi:hypothetical protein